MVAEHLEKTTFQDVLERSQKLFTPEARKK